MGSETVIERLRLSDPMAIDLFDLIIRSTGRFYRDFYVVGDIHGEIEGLRTILRRAKLIDASDRWIGGQAQVVQCGDAVDRGPHSEACLNLLMQLRREAHRAAGGVDILVGNHELALVQGEYGYSNVENPRQLAERLKREILSGRLVAARAYRHYLMTHAGICPELMQELVEVVGAKTDWRVTVAGIARHLNILLKQAVRSGDFSHSIFRVGWFRGGTHPYGGIFWADFRSDHTRHSTWPNIWQVFGHTPPFGDDPAFRISTDEKRINIDVGICGLYGGRLAYVKLETDRVVGFLNGETGFQEQTLCTIPPTEQAVLSYSS